MRTNMRIWIRKDIEQCDLEKTFHGPGKSTDAHPDALTKSPGWRILAGQ